MSAFVILVLLALILAIVNLFNQRYPFLAVAVLLLAIALLIGGGPAVRFG